MSKKKPANLGAYADVVGVLDAVLREEELIMSFETKGAAVNFRQRCHRLRQMLRQKAEEQIELQLTAGKHPLSTFPTTPYDKILIQTQEEPPELHFSLRDEKKHLSALRKPDGTPISIRDDTEDDFTAAVEIAARKLGLE